MTPLLVVSDLMVVIITDVLLQRYSQVSIFSFKQHLVSTINLSYLFFFLLELVIARCEKKGLKKISRENICNPINIDFDFRCY